MIIKLPSMCYWLAICDVSAG